MGKLVEANSRNYKTENNFELFQRGKFKFSISHVTRIFSFFLSCISSLFSFIIIYFRSNLFLFLINLILQLNLNISCRFLDFDLFFISWFIVVQRKIIDVLKKKIDRYMDRVNLKIRMIEQSLSFFFFWKNQDKTIFHPSICNKCFRSD